MKRFALILTAVAALACGAADVYFDNMKAGHAALAKRDYATATAKFDAAAQAASNSDRKYDAVYYNSTVLRQQKKLTEAIAMMEKAAALPKLSSYNLATAYYVLGDYCNQAKQAARSKEFYAKSAQLQAGWASARAQTMLGDLAFRGKDYAEAQKRFNAGATQKGGDPGSQIISRIGLSRVARVAKEYAKADKELVEAEKIAKSKKGMGYYLWNVLMERRMLLLDQKKFQAALAACVAAGELKLADKGYTASAYSGAAQIAFSDLKDLKLAKKYIDLAQAQKASYGFDRALAAKIAKASSQK